MAPPIGKNPRKKTVRMPTLLQIRLAELIIANSKLPRPGTYTSLLKKAGYKGTENQTTNVIRTQGVQRALAERGFTVNNAKRVVTKIMMDDDVDASSRLKATDQVFKVHGEYAPEKHDNRNVTVDITKSFTEEEIAKIKAGVRAKQLGLDDGQPL